MTGSIASFLSLGDCNRANFWPKHGARPRTRVPIYAIESEGMRVKGMIGQTSRLRGGCSPGSRGFVLQSALDLNDRQPNER
jgi:hypothetical protein